jgi:hypothetical protein
VRTGGSTVELALTITLTVGLAITLSLGLAITLTDGLAITLSLEISLPPETIAAYYLAFARAASAAAF